MRNWSSWICDDAIHTERERERELERGEILHWEWGSVPRCTCLALAKLQVIGVQFCHRCAILLIGTSLHFKITYHEQKKTSLTNRHPENFAASTKIHSRRHARCSSSRKQFISDLHFSKKNIKKTHLPQWQKNLLCVARRKGTTLPWEQLIHVITGHACNTPTAFLLEGSIFKIPL